jgi:hypothetical protein
VKNQARYIETESDAIGVDYVGGSVLSMGRTNAGVERALSH